MINKIIKPLSVGKKVFGSFTLESISKSFDDILFVFRDENKKEIEIYLGKKDLSRNPYSSTENFSIFIGNDTNVNNIIIKKIVYIFIYIVKKNEGNVKDIDCFFKREENQTYNQNLKNEIIKKIGNLYKKQDINILTNIITDLVGDKISYNRDLKKEEIEKDYLDLLEKLLKDKSSYIVKDYPKMLILELSYNCNLKCIMCNKTEEKFGKFMDLDFFKRIIDEFGNKIKILRLNGFGETLLTPNLVEYLNYLKPYKGKIYIEIINNGTIFKKEVFETLAYLEANIWFSFDGGDKKTFEKIRIGANFELVCKNIEKVMKIYINHKLQDNISFLSIYQESNINNLDKILNIAYKNSIKYILLATVNGGVIGEIPFEEKLKNIKFRTKIFKKLINFYNKAENLGIHLYNEDKVYGYEIGYSKSYKTNMTNGCKALEKEFFIGYDGKVSRICNMHNPFYLGNIKNAKFDDIWNSISYKFLRFVEKEKKHNYKCSTCNWINRYPRNLY